jgi:hypothetical protein
MREEVIIQSIGITKKKEQQFFQVKLPRDTNKIIGIETGLYVESTLPVFFPYIQGNANIIRQNRLMGTLQLHSSGKPNLFYAKELFDNDINVGANEMKNVPDVIERRLIEPQLRKGEDVPNDGNNFSDFTIWSHGTKREEDPIDVCGCQLINGQFKDTVGEYYNINIKYRVILYIWIERKVNDKQ